ncbi:MAG: hypothetical protein ABIR66_05535, partial [Saprospiraceae bacterium]
MKTKPWIDELYQEHLATREIPFDLNQWAKAEALIIAQEKADNRRNVIIWSLFLGIICALSVLGWNQFVISRDTDLRSLPPEMLEVKPQLANPEVAQHTETKNLDNKQPEINQTAISSKHTDISSPGFSSKHIIASNGSMSIYSSKHNNIENNRLIASGNKDLIEKTLIVTENANSKLDKESILFTKQELMDINVLNTNWNVLSLNQDRELKIPANEISDEPIQIKKSGWKENGVRMTLAQESGLQLTNRTVQHAGFEWFH